MADHSSTDLRYLTLTTLLHYRAKSAPDRRAYVYLADGENESDAFTFATLEQRAVSIAHRLAAVTSPGDRALLLYPAGLEFMAAFFGCLLAGVVAVPSYPPKRNRPDPRLQTIVEDAGARLVLTDSSVLAEIEPRLQNSPWLRTLIWIATDTPDPTQTIHNLGALPIVRPDDLAFLQYTSGSTATPKGVMVSHANLLHNLDDLDQGWDHDENSVMITWLPIFHDMGLIYGALMPLFRGFLCIMLPPAAFLQRPIRWLEAISRYRGTHSAAPNFAYDLCVASTTAEQRTALDLSSWHLSLNAAEPVRANTLAAFNTAFALCGLDPLTVKPGFGLAEATLKVTALPRAEATSVVHLEAGALARHKIQEVAPDHPNVIAIVGCGWGQVDNRTVIVDPETRESCSADQVGEIWFAGPSVAQGYWQRAEATAETFQATLADGSGPWMRTGDLGFSRGREIYVTGRLKDLIILRGLNHYPQDIELTIEHAHPSIRAGCTAAFSIDTPNGEALAIVAEIERTHLRKFDCAALVSALREAVAVNHELPVNTIVFLKPASIPKTSSGKIQRRLARQRLLDNDFAAVATWTIDLAATTAQPIAPTANNLEVFIAQTMATLLKLDISQIDVTTPFVSLGLDSLAAVELSGVLETHLGRRLPPTLAYDFPHIRALAAHLTGERPSSVAPPAPRPPSTSPEPIAVVGLGCRFPGADSPSAFWDLLTSGRDSISSVPVDRWDVSSCKAPPWGGFLAKVDQFDAEFFGISAREADLIDPQHRLLLETSWEALEQAGINPTSLAGTSTGVFIGISTHDYRLMLARSPQGTAPHTGTGNALSIAANRLSYSLDLRGPSMAIDTACSSALVALHHAIRSLRVGESDLALVGGVNLLLAPDVSESFAAAGMLAPDGRCKTFDASADGYVRSEGAGVVVLKPLSAAQRDGDTILALVHGSAINQDGRSNGLTAPNGPAQQVVIQSALTDAQVAPADISFVETHGTGTPLGDPIEVNALHSVLAIGRAPHAPCLLGAVKTQIGHLEAAAGIAGFIKTVLCLHHGLITGNLHLREPSRHLAAAAPIFAFPSGNTTWTGSRRWAGVSSFGFGGTNGHVILGAAPESNVAAPPSRPAEPYLLSARDPAALRDLATAHAACLRGLNDEAWPHAAYTTATGRAEFPHRIAVVATSPAQAAVHLGKADPIAPPSHPPRIAFLFSGQGSLYAGAGKELRTSAPVFARALEECREHVRRLAGWDVIEALDSTEKLAHTEFAQVALFSLEYSLAKLWQSWGFKPTAVAGHSVGEYAAAVIAGIANLPDALALLITRARLMGKLDDTGTMAAISAPAATVEALAITYGAEIGAYNSARQTVITGSAASVKATVEAARSAGLRVTPLSVAQGYHSAEMAPMLPAFRSAAESTSLHRPKLAFVSSSTGKVVGTEIATAEYWTNQIRQPVRWAETVQSMAAIACDLMIEVGPRNLLATLSAQSWPDQPVQWLTSLQPDTSDWTTLVSSAARAWELGVPVDWTAVHQGLPRRRCNLPTYPFQRRRRWFTDTPSAVFQVEDKNLATTLAADPALSLAEKEAIPALLAALKRAQHAPATAAIHVINWQPQPLEAPATVAARSWLIIGSDPTLGRQLISRNQPAKTTPHFQPGDWTNLVHVVGDESTDIECRRLLDTIQTLLRHSTSARLHVVTRAAVAATPMDGRALQLSHAATWGMGLAFGLEQPERWGGLIDLPPTAVADETTVLVDELIACSSEDQVALRPGRFVPRLVPTELPASPDLPLSSEANYWITGGLGGVGLQTARWLVDRGARHLILSGRSTPKESAQLAIADLTARGVEIQTVALDVTDATAVNALLDRAAAADRPVRGIIHAAGVLHNQTIEEVTRESFAAVLQPKVKGGLVLHEATLKRDLDFLVFFSSIASVWGSKWQLHYSAANRFLDALAVHRRAIALPAVSINWGPWSGGGMAGAEEQQLLARMGITALSSTANLTALRNVLAAGTTQAVVARVDWPTFRSLVELHRPKPLLALLAPVEAAEPINNLGGTPAIITTWTKLDPINRTPAVVAWLQSELAAVLGLKEGRLPNPREGLFALGLDSLLAVELRNRLARAIGRPLPATLAFDHGYIIALADYLVGKLWPVAATAPIPSAPSPDAPPPPVVKSNATTDELDDALEARLARLESLTRRD